METTFLSFARAALLAMSASALLALPAAADQAKVIADGKAEFDQYCVACHGARGKGDGRMAEILTLKPADLSTIAKRNEGVFPFWRVYQVIDGRQPVKGHDTFQMPVAGTRFQQDEGKPGFLPAHVRILLLTHYIESLQEK